MYRIVPDTAVSEQVAAPIEALPGFTDVLGVLELMPWNGRPQHEDNPDGAVRQWKFGAGQAGQVVYLILEDHREAHLLLVQWWV